MAEDKKKEEDKKVDEADTDSDEYDVTQLSGVQRTAILLLSLTEEGTSTILKELEPRQVQGVSLEMVNSVDVTQEKATAVYRLFLDQIQTYSWFKLERLPTKSTGFSSRIG